MKLGVRWGIRLLKGCFEVICFGLLITRLAPHLIQPALHMDEAYYIGAARAMLRGDLLLTSYSFDKLFLQPFVLVPGILFAGENIMGFRLTGFLFSVAGFYLFRSVLNMTWRRAFAGEGGWQSDLVSSFFSLAFFTLPLTSAHGASAMTEPALMFFLLLAAYQTLRVQPVESVSWATSWGLASLAKLSSVMWLPYFVGTEIIAQRKSHNLASGVRDSVTSFFYRTRVLWALAFLFMLFNKKKFAALTWFSHLGKTKVEHPSFVARLDFWWDTLHSVTSGLGTVAFIWVGIALVIGAVSAWNKRRDCSLRYKVEALSNTEILAIVILVAPFFHFVGLALSGAPLYPRYILIFLPQLLMALIVATALTLAPFQRRKSRVWVAPCLLFVMAGLLMSVSLRAEQVALEPHPERGRSLEIARDLIPQSAVVYSPHLWELYPYEATSWDRSTCQNLVCSWRRRGQAVDWHQFRIKFVESGAQMDQLAPILDRADRRACYSIHEFEETLLLKRNLRETLDERLKLGGAEVNLNVEAPSNSYLQSEAVEWTELGTTRIDQGVPISGTIIRKEFSLAFEGHLVLAHRANENHAPVEMALIFRDIQLKRPFIWNEAIDLFALLWKSRVIRLGPLDRSQPISERSLLNLKSFDLSNSSAKVRRRDVDIDYQCLSKVL